MVNVLFIGATGYIGSEAALAIRKAGHQVTALVRSASSDKSKKLLRNEITLIEQDITKIEDSDLKAILQKGFGAIVLATNLHGEDVNKILNNLEDNSNVTLVYTSGVLVYGLNPNTLVDENTKAEPINAVKWRIGSENQILASKARRSIVLRPGFIYGGKGGYLESFNAIVNKNEKPTIYGNGKNIIPTTHVVDLADIFVRVIENQQASGIYNCTNDYRETFLDIISATAVAAGQSADYINFVDPDPQNAFHDYFIINQRISSLRAKKELGWVHNHASIVDEAPVLFNSWKAYQ